MSRAPSIIDQWHLELLEHRITLLSRQLRTTTLCSITSIKISPTSNNTCSPLCKSRCILKYISKVSTIQPMGVGVYPTTTCLTSMYSLGSHLSEEDGEEAWDWRVEDLVAESKEKIRKKHLKIQTSNLLLLLQPNPCYQMPFRGPLAPNQLVKCNPRVVWHQLLGALRPQSIKMSSWNNCLAQAPVLPQVGHRQVLIISLC